MVASHLPPYRWDQCSHVWPHAAAVGCMALDSQDLRPSYLSAWY